MKEQWRIDTNWFLSKAGIFIFIHALGLYLFLQIFNALADGFIATFFNIKMPLFFALIGGLLLAISYQGEEKDENKT